MREKDLIDLIRAFDAFARLNDLVKELTNGCAIENGRFLELYYIADVIHRNCRYSAEDDETCRVFWDIMYDKGKTPEEKYGVLKQ